MKKLYLKDISKELNIPEYVLRFYDKKNVIPFLERDQNNYRFIYEDKLEWVKLISCLKKTGMSLKEIKEYIDLIIEGDQTIERRLNIILKQEVRLIKSISDLHDQLDYIRHKKEIYKEKLKINK